MKEKRSVIAAIACLILVGAYFVLMQDSPEKKVRNRLDLLENCVDKEAGEPKTTLIVKNERLSGLLADEVEVDGDASLLTGSHDSTEFLRLIQQGRFMFQSVDLSFSDVTVVIESEAKANVECMATLSLAGKGGQTRSDRIVRRLRIGLVKPENDWAFKSFNVMQTVEQ